MVSDWAFSWSAYKYDSNNTEMNWNYEDKPIADGWYAVLICYDAMEGIFPDARFWNGEKWCSRECGDKTSYDCKGILAFGNKCESEEAAKKLAYEYDIGG